MHYHVIAGPRGSKTPTSLKFKDKMEGIHTFIEMAKTIFHYMETPPPYKEIFINTTTSIIRMQDSKNRIIFVFCGNTCDDDDNLEFKLQL